MLMPDVNVLVYAHRADEPVHAAYRQWFDEVVGIF
jgi:predicted nucleic acid-binding protein